TTDYTDSTEKFCKRICVICGWLCDTLSRMRVVVFLLTVLLIAISFVNFDNAGAQTTRPTLISHPDSTRAIAFESVTRQREPFTTTAPVRFGSDSATRIMLFAMNLQLQPGEVVTAYAE